MIPQGFRDSAVSIGDAFRAHQRPVTQNWNTALTDSRDLLVPGAAGIILNLARAN